jgi:hypothetical protein
MSKTAYRINNKEQLSTLLDALEEKLGKHIYANTRTTFYNTFVDVYGTDGYVFVPDDFTSTDSLTYSDNDSGYIKNQGYHEGQLADLVANTTTFDPVHEPAHYHLDDKGTELKDLMPALLFKFRGVEAGYVFNMIKYAVRQKDNRIQDLEKVIEYAQMAVDYLKSQTEAKAETKQGNVSNGDNPVLKEGK